MIKKNLQDIVGEVIQQKARLNQILIEWDHRKKKIYELEDRSVEIIHKENKKWTREQSLNDYGTESNGRIRKKLEFQKRRERMGQRKF